jgi:hypothetical protein
MTQRARDGGAAMYGMSQGAMDGDVMISRDIPAVQKSFIEIPSDCRRQSL